MRANVKRSRVHLVQSMWAVAQVPVSVTRDKQNRPIMKGYRQNTMREKHNEGEVSFSDGKENNLENRTFHCDL